ncbi:uncharacterized protein PFL1_06791 [Pseudozyma flocculosa PF-1]|uniref:Related to RNA-binding protein rnp24 n=2 Tax=Pseudozyma flocculosa TaxID=84751 RepID=A0A5C3FCC8_9BASI|nr:uncharacterized protein PFL1_06791 [Pseudozyma flocculosa PF-1]EPQ25654.1 hypothetical protein PFL1_06791 [Pseudozyma flocculosa PF-1]SPO42062.1 related to RNA-binding protein rnp24 [Pseudozyma flocculosa]
MSDPLDDSARPVMDATAAAAEQPAMTNKEKRKALQAAKRAAKEAKALEAPSAPTTPAAASSTTTKRKRDAADEGNDAAEEEPAADGEEQQQEEEEGEVQALSHKEQRRRKKLEKKARLEGKELGVAAAKHGANGSSSSSRAAGATAGAAAAPVKRSPWCIWVANMRFTTDEQKLKEFLENQGIEGISRVHMPKGPRKEEANKGFAYVDVPSAEMVERAIALSESRLDGRNLLIKSGNDFQGRPQLNASAASLAMTALGTAPQQPSQPAASSKAAANGADAGGVDDSVAFSALPASVRGKTGLTKTAQKILRSQKNPPGPTLFLGNLSFESTEDGIRSLLENSAKRREEWRKADKEDKKLQRKRKRQERKRAKAEEGDDGSDSSASESESESESEDGSASSSSSESEDEGGKVRGKTTTTTAKKSSEGGIRGAGIRKIRMGTFQDTGKCKGFAFVDFHTPAHATASLIDGRNAHLDGRTIVLQYAGADAIRRGAPKGTVTGGPRPASRPPRQWGVPAAGQGAAGEGMTEEDRIKLRETAPAPGTFDPDAPVEKRHKETKEERMARRAAQNAAAAAAGGEGGGGGGERERERKRRAKPGAALANAQRENVGIVEHTGTKTTFD